MNLNHIPSVYTLLDFYNVIILAIIILSLIHQMLRKNRLAINFFYVCIYIMIFGISDIGFNYYSQIDTPNALTFLKIDTFVYYFIQPFWFYSFLSYLDVYINNNKKCKWFWIIANILVAVYLIFMILTPFTGFYYYFDAENLYHRGILHPVSVAIDGCFMLLGFIFTLQNYKKIQKTDFFIIFLFFFIPSISEIIQLIIPDFSIIATGLSLPIIIIFINNYKRLAIQLRTTDMYAVNKQNELISLQNKTILSLSNLVENRGYDKGNHIIRVTEYVKALTKKAMENGVYEDTLTPKYTEYLVNAVPLHDIGKIVVPDEILNKHGVLSKEEFELMKNHVTEGEKIVHIVLAYENDEKQLKIAENIAKYHHEKWNGNGYPSGLKGTAIPLSARIMAIADVFDALVSSRIYKSAILSLDKAFDLMKENAGQSFDPVLIEQFMLIKDEISAIIETDGVMI